MKRYYAKPGTNILNDESAQVVGTFLEQNFPDGRYDKKKIIELAKSKSSPIHKYFEWDDTKAAKRYRLIQAGTLIRCLVIKIDDEIVPAAVSVIEVQDDGTQYRTFMDIEQAKKSPSLYDQVMEEALRGLNGWSMRFASLEKVGKFKGVFREIRKVTKTKTTKTKLIKNKGEKKWVSGTAA